MLDKLRSRIVHLGPSLLSVPVKLTPFALKRQVLEQVLSWQFRQALDDGELEFLEGRWLSIHVRDIDLQWFTSVVNGKLVVSQNAQADVSFSADASDLLMIAARKQDPDTLFFQRRLVIEGDTELGLYVKNLMDAIELEQMPKALRMLIRVEIPIDAPGIDALLRRSFESDAEAKLVHDLREDGFLTLGLVATDDEGQVIGYVAFSPVDVQGEDLQWVGMAPLAVDEKYRGQGLARQLVYEGLDSLNEFGYAAVVTLGDPALYSRFGFELAAHHDLRCRWPGTESAFQVHRLADDALNGVTGLVEYHEHFNRF